MLHCLHNASASTELNVLLNGKQIRHEHQPVYLGVTLNRSLNFHTHMVKTAAKVRTRNNLITKLAGSTWGDSARTLRTATLALCFLVVEYCAPVWCRNAYTKLVDIQLNSAMRTISGSIMSTHSSICPVPSSMATSIIQHSSSSHPLNVSNSQSYGQNPAASQFTSV